MVRGLVPSMSDVSVEPFWCDYRTGSYMIRYKCWIPFFEWRYLVSYQEYSIGGSRPFWYDCGICSHMIRYKFYFHFDQMWVLRHSDMTVGSVPTWSDIRVIAILGMEVPGQLPGILSLGLRAILIWLWDVLSHDQMWVHGHSDVIEGCVPTWSDIRVVAILWM